MGFGNLLLVEGFDYLDAASGLGAGKWTQWRDDYTAATIVTGRHGGKALRFVTTYDDIILSKDMPPGMTKFMMGFAIRCRTESPTNQRFFSCLTNHTMGYQAIDLWMGSDRRIELYRYDYNKAATAAIQLPLNGWVYVEIEAHLSATGYMKAYIDGTLVADTGEVDTRPGSSATAITRLIWGSQAWRQDIDIDDLYISDMTAEATPTAMGPSRITLVTPTGTDTNVGFAPGGGAANVVAAVAGTAPAGDSTYAEADNIDDTLLVTSTDTLPSEITTVRGVALTSRQSKTDGASRSLTHVMKVGGVEYEAFDPILLTESVNMVQTIFELNPASTAEWDISEVNDAAFGVKVTA